MPETATEIEGWKEIAYRLRVSVDTAQRWARIVADPLPVYWTRHNGHVRALVEEIDAWQRRQRVTTTDGVR